jgi:hypothetical protein
MCVIEKSANDLLYVIFALFVKEPRSVDEFCVLGSGAVDWFDMGIRLVLTDVWRFVLELCESLRDVFEHGDVDSAFRLIPVNVHAEVPLAIPIM